MANLFIDLPMPVLNGAGASVDTSAMGKSRSIVCKGSFPGVTITVQISNDGGTSWAALVSFTSSGKKKVIDVAAQFMRVNVRGRKSGAAFSANCDVGSPDDGGQFAILPLPAGDGTGAPVDVSALGVYTTIVVAGDFKGVLITVESSEDGNDWAACGPGYQSGANQRSGEVIANFMRTRVAGRKSTESFAAVVAVGAINDASAGGGPPTGPAGGDLSGSYPNPVIARPRNCYVFRPGGVATANVYTDWASLYAAVNATDGERQVCFDDSIVSPCVIPAGVYNMTGVIWRGFPGMSGGGIATFPEVDLADGAVFTGLRYIEGPMWIDGQGAAPHITDLGPSEVVFIKDQVRLIQSGPAPMFLVSTNFPSFYLDDGCGMQSGTIIEVVGPNTVNVSLGENCFIGQSAIAGPVGSTLGVSYASSYGVESQPQAAFLGTITRLAGWDRLVVSPQPPAVHVAPYTTGYNFGYERCDVSGGAFLVTLRDMTNANLQMLGMRIVIGEVSGSPGLTVGPFAGQTINGGAAPVAVPAGGAIELVCDGISDWEVVNIYNPAVGVVSERYAPPEKWYQSNIPASQANVALNGMVSVNFDNIKAIRAGSIVGLSTRLTAAITDVNPNSCVVTVTVNGVGGALNVSHHSALNPTGGEATQAAGIDTFVAGDLLGIEITTLGSFVPAGSLDIEAWLDCEF